MSQFGCPLSVFLSSTYMEINRIMVYNLRALSSFSVPQSLHIAYCLGEMGSERNKDFTVTASSLTCGGWSSGLQIHPVKNDDRSLWEKVKAAAKQQTSL